jgi:hypothetical protein
MVVVVRVRVRVRVMVVCREDKNSLKIFVIVLSYVYGGYLESSPLP